MNINREEALRRINSPANLANSVGKQSSEPVVGASMERREIIRNAPRRGESVREDVRDAIACEALMGIPQKQIAEKFGVAQQTVSSYKTNHIGGRPPSDNRKQQHEERVGTIRDLALTKLMGALGLVDEAKLENLEAKDLGKFAKDMASVYGSLTPKDPGADRAPINVIVYSPKLQDESKYKVVEVG